MTACCTPNVQHCEKLNDLSERLGLVVTSSHTEQSRHNSVTVFCCLLTGAHTGYMRLRLRLDEPFVLESSNRPEMDDVARSLLYVIRIY